MYLLPAAERCGRIPLRYRLRCRLRLQRRLRIPWPNSGSGAEDVGARAARNDGDDAKQRERVRGVKPGEVTAAVT
jgi:hypothetical protein